MLGPTSLDGDLSRSALGRDTFHAHGMDMMPGHKMLQNTTKMLRNITKILKNITKTLQNITKMLQNIFKL